MSSRQLGYLRDMLERITWIEVDSAIDHDGFLESRPHQESIKRSFEIIGEIVKRLDQQVTSLLPTVPWSSYAKFRDVLIHQYDQIDDEAVWEYIQEDLPILKSAVLQLIHLLNQPKNTDESSGQVSHDSSA